MNKMEQRLTDLTKTLASARSRKDQEQIEVIEDEIAELEYQLEQEYNREFGDHDDY